MQTRSCRACRGSGRDKTLPQRYTTGGHNSRDCEKCGGTGVIELPESEDNLDATSDVLLAEKEDDEWTARSAATLLNREDEDA